MPKSKTVSSPISRIRSSISLRDFSTASSIRPGWMRPSEINFSRAILAISRRIGSNPLSTTVSGVSSIITSIPVKLSMVRIFRPSRPIIRPFMSSFGRWITLTVASVTSSAALRWMASVIKLFARRFTSTFNCSSYCLTITAVSLINSSSVLCSTIFLASSSESPEIRISSLSCFSLASFTCFSRTSIFSERASNLFSFFIIFFFFFFKFFFFFFNFFFLYFYLFFFFLYFCFFFFFFFFVVYLLGFAFLFPIPFHFFGNEFLHVPLITLLFLECQLLYLHLQQFDVRFVSHPLVYGLHSFLKNMLRQLNQ